MKFWHSKKVFITGHTGFKGSWLSLWLQNLGAEVVGYSLESPTIPNLFSTANVASNMHTILGDIRDFELLKNSLIAQKPEIIIHMAAQSLVRHSYTNPLETYSTNVMGTVTLLEAVRQAGKPTVIVNVTSDKCYQNNEWAWGYRENEPMGGHDPYSNSKGCAELVTSAYRSSYFNSQDYQTHGITLASARAGNVIGGGDWAKDRLIPDLIHSCMQQRILKLRNPQATRPWQHVLEPLAGYLRLAEALYEAPTKYAQAWNFGPNEDDVQTVQWITEYILKLWGDSISWQLENKSQPHEANYLKLDCSKAKTELKWHPKWNLETGLERVVAWYKAFQASENMQQFSLKQIEDYMTT